MYGHPKYDKEDPLAGYYQMNLEGFAGKLGHQSLSQGHGRVGVVEQDTTIRGARDRGGAGNGQDIRTVRHDRHGQATHGPSHLYIVSAAHKGSSVSEKF